MTALVSANTIDSRLVFWSCVVVSHEVSVGPLTAFPRTGPSVPWVSLPGPTGVPQSPG